MPRGEGHPDAHLWGMRNSPCPSCRAEAGKNSECPKEEQCWVLNDTPQDRAALLCHWEVLSRSPRLGVTGVRRCREHCSEGIIKCPG